MICIGIISYLPDDNIKRDVRFNRLTKLLNQLTTHFKLPILIIAQNWNDIKIDRGDVAVFYYNNKLGITGARRELRDKFIKSSYDYMIMMDDDMELTEDQSEYDLYLDIIKTHNKDYYYLGNFLNNFSCISRSCFININYDTNVNPEFGTGYEDWIFQESCKAMFNCERVEVNLSKYDRKHFLNDEYSTWLSSNKNIIELNDKVSKAKIKALKRKYGKSLNDNWF